ncbi:hypothetical protein PORY_001341 [Pneumocystis oryctolagi]|uniref:Uncharacterized protein n=1 Tax=Pneumocystis oryctolagi TaxID=42067 RepID=A0ACB7CC90_9ASCO|nr:hypothetical protein PORY_001341 [Pneumocystis oryctolagi]
MIISNISRLKCYKHLYIYYFSSRPSKKPGFFYSNVLKNIQIFNKRSFQKFYSNRNIEKNNTQIDPSCQLSFSKRLKYLMRRYGATAASVYLGISVIDFAISWGVVKSLGFTAIKFYEKILLEIERHTGWRLKRNTASLSANKESTEYESPSIWTEIAIAYGIHKLLILIRVPLTAALTPPLVRILNQRGWSIGKLKD